MTMKRIIIKIVRIYVLKDPRTGEVRYVGKTIKKLIHRLSDHCSATKETNRKCNWIRSLLKIGLKPIIEEIEICFMSNWAKREAYWIQYYKGIGCQLTNSTNGGEGTFGWRHSEESKLKMRGKRKPLSKQTRLNMSLAHIGRGRKKGFRHSEESKIKMSIARKGKKQTKEHTFNRAKSRRISDLKKGLGIFFKIN